MKLVNFEKKNVKMNDVFSPTNMNLYDSIYVLDAIDFKHVSSIDSFDYSRVIDDDYIYCSLICKNKTLITIFQLATTEFEKFDNKVVNFGIGFELDNGKFICAEMGPQESSILNDTIIIFTGRHKFTMEKMSYIYEFDKLNVKSVLLFIRLEDKPNDDKEDETSTEQQESAVITNIDA